MLSSTRGNFRMEVYPTATARHCITVLEILTFSGLDLEGNTYWEFKDQLSSKQGRMRRIVQYPSTIHYSDVSGQISPAWHQWLRHTRDQPPTLTEQSQDLVRQQHLKVLAAQADARWAAKPSYLDAPGHDPGRPLPSREVPDSQERPQNGVVSAIHENEGVKTTVGRGLNDQVAEKNKNHRDFVDDQPIKEPMKQKKAPVKDDPWKKARGGPSEEWQPKAWSPGVAPKR